MAHGGYERQRRLARSHDQEVAPIVGLEIREIDVGANLAFDLVVANVADDADNLRRDASRTRSDAQRNPLAEGIARGPVFARHRFVDHSDDLTLASILVSEPSSCNERNTKGL